jgi:hypothetical protein
MGGYLLDYFLSCLFLYILTRLKAEEVYLIPEFCQVLTVNFRKRSGRLFYGWASPNRIIHEL